jgi:cytochrome c5
MKNARSTLCVLAGAWLLGAGPALAQHAAFPFGDPKQGKTLLEAKCTACHVARFGGDGSGVYSRSPRRVSSAASLLAWVQRCNAGNKLDLGPEAEESLAAHLNEAYYRFK